LRVRPWQFSRLLSDLCHPGRLWKGAASGYAT
jgi:hypothetical protein